MTDESTATLADPATSASPTEPAADAPAQEDKKAKLTQTVDIKDVGPCRKHIKVQVSRDDIEKAFSEKYKELVGDSWVPGFRPGKAPREIVVRKYKKEVGDQVKALILMGSLEQLAEDFDIAPITPPDLNPNNLIMPADGPFIYEFEVEVRPQFDLPDYKGLKLKRPVYPITEEDVAREEIRQLLPYGQVVPKPEGNAQVGDLVTFDMTTTFEGEKIGESKELTLRVEDSIAFRDGIAASFGKELMGACAGDQRTVTINMTDSAALPKLKGKTVQGHLDVKEVKKVRMPELDSEFLNATFYVRNVEQLREQIRVSLERRLEYTQRQSARDQIIDHITTASSWDLPENMLMRQARKTIARKVMEMKEAGLSEEEIMARQRMLERDVVASTAKALKEHFVLQKLAEVEKIEVNDDDIAEEIERLAMMSNDTPRRVRAQMEKEDLLETLAAQLVERKALDLILENAQYEDQPIAKESGFASTPQQTVEGELNDPTAAPPEEKKAEEVQANS